MSQIGGSLLFRYYGIGALFVAVLHSIVQRFVQKPRKLNGHIEELHEEGSGSSGNNTTDKFSDFS